MLSDRDERRPLLTDPDVLEALAHPVRLDLLTYLMAAGPATASTCARAVGDTPSNCSYHLRTLAGHDLVEAVQSTDRRQRPWRAKITGFSIDPIVDPETAQGRSNAAVLSASLALEQRLLSDYLAHRDHVSDAWREADSTSSYTLRVTPQELGRVTAEIDALLRPLIAAGRDDTPGDAELVQCGVYAFPRMGEPWQHPRR
ncbi:MAG: helix-turn-helix domain-containing protein [Solirubrobacteraceae bacterium]